LPLSKSESGDLVASNRGALLRLLLNAIFCHVGLLLSLDFACGERKCS